MKRTKAGTLSSASVSSLPLTGCCVREAGDLSHSRSLTRDPIFFRARSRVSCALTLCPLTSHLSPFHSTDYHLVLLPHTVGSSLMPVLQPISLHGMDASLSSAHLSFSGSRSKPLRVGGFGHTPIMRVVFVISASCLLRLSPYPSAGPTSPTLHSPGAVSGTAVP